MPSVTWGRIHIDVGLLTCVHIFSLIPLCSVSRASPFAIPRHLRTLSELVVPSNDIERNYLTMDMLSSVDAPDAKDQIGAGPWDAFVKFAKWLYGKKCKTRFRIAPSLVTRGEAELLGVSSPRFALRCYFFDAEDRSPLGFVNARRLQVLSETVSSWGVRDSTDQFYQLEEPIDPPTPKDLVARQSYWRLSTEVTKATSG